MANLVFKKADDAKAAITDSARKEIVALYSKWSDEIGKKAEYYKTKTNASSWLQEMNMRQLQAQLDATSKHIANEVNGIVKDTIYQVSDAVVQANNGWLIKLGFPVTGVESAFVSVPDQTVRRLVTGQIYESGWSLSKSIWSDNEDTLKKLYEIVAQGLAQNMTAYDISKLLEQYVDPSRAKQWNLRMADGKNIYKKAVDYNAQRLARTLAQHGYQTSVIAVTEKNPFIMDIIWRANGSRVCQLCMDRDGQHFPKNDLPLDHPNGMCTMEPAVDPDLTDKLADWINNPDGTFPEIDAFASEFGYVPDVKKSMEENNSILSDEKIINVIGMPGKQIDIDTALKTVNPNFPEQHKNCQRCVVAYELQRRGYDVEAMPFDGNYPSIFSLFKYPERSDRFKYVINKDYIDESKGYKINRSPKATANTVKGYMLDWGNNSRATLVVEWRGTKTSHIINVENVNGDVWLIDAQCGRKTTKIEEYLKETKCAEIELCRTDNLIFQNENEIKIKTLSTMVKQRR